MSLLFLPLLPSILASLIPTPLGPITYQRDWAPDELEDLATAVKEGLKFRYSEETGDGVNWQVEMGPVLDSPLITRLREELSLPSQLLHQRATGRILRRGDQVRISRHCTGSQSGTTALLVLSRPSDKNDYGELLFFSSSTEDIIGAVQPSTFSLLTFPCGTPYQWQYPAVRTQAGLVFIELLFGVAGEWGEEGVLPFFNQQPFPLQGAPDSVHPFPTVPTTPLFSLGADKHLWLVDGLFAEETLDLLTHHFLASEYVYHEADDGGYSDNVVFLTPQLLFELVRTPIWRRLSRVMAELTGHNDWYPYDVSTNLNKAWDHTRIHPDCFYREEYTMLVYLNREYQPGDLGGTVWYESEKGEEILGSVMNRYGRLAVFQCSIPHAARPPHARLGGPRLTFAIKVSRGRAEALIRGYSESSFIVEGFDYETAEVDGVDLEAALETHLRRKLATEYSGDSSLLEEELERAARTTEQHYREEFGEMLRNLGGDGGVRVKDEL